MNEEIKNLVNELQEEVNNCDGQMIVTIRKGSKTLKAVVGTGGQLATIHTVNEMYLCDELNCKSDDIKLMTLMQVMTESEGSF